MQRFFRVRYLLVVVIALIVAAGVLGFAAANTVPGSSAGDGQGAISGYTVSAIKYTLATDPANIASVQFTVAGSTAPTSVKVKLVSTGTTYADCTAGTPASGSYPYSCNVTGVTVLAADQLRVIAVQ